MDFRTRLRDQIKFTGLLDKEVAEKAGITKHAIDTYVGSRACMPSADIAVRLAKVLGVSVEWLVTGEDASISQNDIQTLIHYFSRLNEHDKKMILLLAKNMFEDE
ncbi:helix-turn-helix domain-containing protein [Treponema sp. UBA3813]|uniref:helix-turn-helix domain-containing protein n=1 Tax=Treponema sp. UBA3813 TaxID=1947715 RepID=UPI0026000779|nr:helix-turn-helix transcriptional regulator [Treponema sp. UBA3813]